MCMSNRDSEKKPFQYNSYDSIFLEPGIFLVEILRGFIVWIKEETFLKSLRASHSFPLHHDKCSNSVCILE